MARKLKFVAQDAMDEFYADYKSDIDFFDLDDFISYCGAAIGDVYHQWFKEQYALLRQEKKDEVVSFDPTWCDTQILDVTNVDGRLFAAYKAPIMAFPYETQSSGLQHVFHADYGGIDEIERTSLDSLWQLKYLPRTDKIFYYSDTDGVGFVSKGICVVKKVRVLFIPSPHSEMNVPDGIVDMVKTKTVSTIKGLNKDSVSKESLDQNINKTIQTELNPKFLKQ